MRSEKQIENKETDNDSYLTNKPNVDMLAFFKRVVTKSIGWSFKPSFAELWKKSLIETEIPIQVFPTFSPFIQFAPLVFSSSGILSEPVF